MTTTSKGYMIGGVGIVSGTGTISATTTALTGSGTAFLSELYVGAVIVSDGQTLAISAVASNTAATLQTAPAVALSGDSFAINGMTNLSNLTTPVTHPRSNFKQWLEKVDLGNGLARGVGRPSVTWTWGFITMAQYDQLRTIITGASTRVYIRTRTTETSDSYKVYSAAALWPDEIDRSATRRVNFMLTFRDLVLL